MIRNKKLKDSLFKAARSIYRTFPIAVAIIILISLTNVLIPKKIFTSFFSKNVLLDSLVGTSLGSILAGNPITSYILGGEFLKQGVSLIAVTSFIVSWVTVGLIQLPAESILLGKKFALIRNIVSFIFAIIVAVITVFILRL